MSVSDVLYEFGFGYIFHYCMIIESQITTHSCCYVICGCSDDILNWIPLLRLCSNNIPSSGGILICIGILHKNQRTQSSSNYENVAQIDVASSWIQLYIISSGRVILLIFRIL